MKREFRKVNRTCGGEYCRREGDKNREEKKKKAGTKEHEMTVQPETSSEDRHQSNTAKEKGETLL